MSKEKRTTVAHPWHGVSPGEKCPEEVLAYIEIVPADTCKYEIEKESGLLMLDRPHKFSNLCPALYGLIPQTYCGEKSAQYAMDKTGRKDVQGDEDPIDICVLAERTLTHGNILLKAKTIGGFRFFDGEEADDKIIAVLADDLLYEQYNDITDIPEKIIDRLKHYFLTYKQPPGKGSIECEITHVYGREEAIEVIQASLDDYQDLYG
jgi:inorganic pyrophosphatase